MSIPAKTNPTQLSVELAATQDDLLASQRLRYRIFAEEQGAILPTASEQLDYDHYDPHCHHLLVRELNSGEVVGSTRILTQSSAQQAGGFYSANEFDIGDMLQNLRGNAIEIGRTCIHPDFRNGAGIGTLWLGLAQFMELHKVDYMFGCASVGVRDGGSQVTAIMNEARRKHLAPSEMWVTPRQQLMPVQPAERVRMPPLLKAYLKLGAWVAGEPCLDTAFNVADIFILLDVNNLNARYHRHFVQSGAKRHKEVDGLRQIA